MARRLKRYGVFLCCFVLLALAGCGQRKQETAAGSDAPATAAATVLRVAVISTRNSSVLERQAAVNEVVRQNMQADYVKVETVNVPPFDSGDPDAVEEFSKRLISESAPDVLVMSRTSAQALDGFEAIFRLDNAIAERLPSFDDLVYKSAAESVRWHGHILGIPRTLDPNMIAYNKAHFAEAGVEPDPDWSWDDFAVASRKVTAGMQAVYSQGAEEGKRVPIRYESTAGVGAVCPLERCWLPFLLSNGGGYLATDQESILIDSKESVEAWRGCKSSLLRMSFKTVWF